MDIQPAYNYSKAVSYMTEYFSKSETVSYALIQAVKEVKQQSLKAQEASTFIYKF